MKFLLSKIWVGKRATDTAVYVSIRCLFKIAAIAHKAFSVSRRNE